MRTDEADWALRFDRNERARQSRVGHSALATARALKERFPETVAHVLDLAEQAMRGELRLPGTGGTPGFVGNPPDWFEVRSQDKEYLWGLNRMFHWLPLMRAFVLTGEDRYAQKVAEELDDWIARCPAPPMDAATSAFEQVNPWRMLEVGIRMYWVWSLIPRYLAGSKWLAGDRAERLAASMDAHAQRLAAFSPRMWPDANHNHYMMEVLGLLCVATAMPDHPQSATWREQATAELVRCCQNQFTPDGGQFEGCPHYHEVCLDVLSRALGALREAGHPAPVELSECLRRGMQYMLQTTRPTGDNVPWGDSDVTPVGIESAVKVFAALGDSSFLRIAARLADEATLRTIILDEAWSIGDLDAAFAEAKREPESLPPTVAWDRGLDQVCARTAWKRDATSVFFACRSPVYNGHSHVDPAGFDYTALGKPLLVDPGRFTYREDADRRWFKNASSHNTVTVNGREPFEYVDSWRYSPQQPGKIVSVESRDGWVTMVGEHHNFAPSIHRRTIVMLPDGALVIVDAFSSLTPQSTAQRWFHFNSQSVSWNPEQGIATTSDDDANVSLFVMPGTRGATLAGRISPIIDVAYPSVRLRVDDVAAAEKLLLACVIVPHRSRELPAVGELRVADDAVRFVRDGVRVVVPLQGGG